MKTGKGDIRSQRHRRKARYQGCRVCGEPAEKRCPACRAIEVVLAAHWVVNLALFVDGSFVTASGERDRRPPRVRGEKYAPLRARIALEHPDWSAAHVETALIEALVGTGVIDGPGHGGAGLVLATSTGEILASRACGFPVAHSSDAELHAVIRGARWAPSVVIYTDSESTCQAASSANQQLDVRFLRESERGAAHALAHELSVEGRKRQAARGAAQTVSEVQP